MYINFLTAFMVLFCVRTVYSGKDECRYARYISGILLGKILHENVTLMFPSLGHAKDACNLLGNSCKGVNLRSVIRRRQYTLASDDFLIYSKNDIAWRKSCSGSCQFALKTDSIRNQKYYRKICSLDPQSTINETWTKWLSWGPCSQSCGTLGEQKRYRQCASQLCSTGKSVEVRVCNYAKKCPHTLSNVFGVFGPEGFQSFGSTPVYSTCIRTEQEDRRACGNQPDSVSREICINQLNCCFANDTVFALHGGPRCFQAKHFIASSGLISWSVWSPWTSCSVSCGSGNRSRKRICTGNIPSSSVCQGPDTETEICNFGVCPCSINPCRNGGVCRVDKRIARGYRCECPSSFVGRNCDFGEPRLVCGNDSISVAFDRRLIEDQGLIDDWRLIHFRRHESPACFARSSHDNSQYVLTIPPPIDRSCGSLIQVSEESYSIRNNVLWKLTDQSASSTVVLLDFSCVYNKRLNMTTDLGFGIRPTIRTLLYKTSRVEFGVDMALYREADFSSSSLIRNSPTVAEGEILYVMISLKKISLTSPDNEILVLDRCYAADLNEEKTPLYDFILDGCSTNPTFTTVLESGLSSNGKWAFRVFEWRTDTPTYDVNIVCKVYVCDFEYESCQPTCDDNLGTSKIAGLSIRQKRNTKNKELQYQFTEKIFARKLFRRKQKTQSSAKNRKNSKFGKHSLRYGHHQMMVFRKIQTGRALINDFIEQAEYFGSLPRPNYSLESFCRAIPNWILIFSFVIGSRLFYILFEVLRKKVFLPFCVRFLRFFVVES